MFAVLPSGEWLTIGVMYAETVLMAESLKRLGKFAVNRARPYMYFEDYPQDKVDDGDWAKSWPSEHTTLAFTAASFTSYLFCQYFPESAYKWAVVGGTYAVATATGILRMCSGNHFFTDVLTGVV